jgi:hypothetical protein
MPVSKKALHRYKILDGLLKNRNGYTIMELTEKVNEELATFQDDHLKDKTVSDRMIRMDLENMMEVYPVIIAKRDKNRFYYETSDESIDNINLREEDKTVFRCSNAYYGKLCHTKNQYHRY